MHDMTQHSQEEIGRLIFQEAILRRISHESSATASVEHLVSTLQRMVAVVAAM
jgi:hypothetical protein